jgi:hypothetical protein
MYADDVQIALTSTPLIILETKVIAENLLNSLKSWYDQNGLKLNASKTQFIILGSKSAINKLPNLSLTLGTEVIEPVDKVKNLGVWFYQYMTFKTHVEKKCKIVNVTLMFFHRVKNVLDEKARLLVIQLLVLSCFDSCSLV